MGKWENKEVSLDLKCGGFILCNFFENFKNENLIEVVNFNLKGENFEFELRIKILKIRIVF